MDFEVWKEIGNFIVNEIVNKNKGKIMFLG